MTHSLQWFLLFRISDLSQYTWYKLTFFLQWFSYKNAPGVIYLNNNPRPPEWIREQWLFETWLLSKTTSTRVLYLGDFSCPGTHMTPILNFVVSWQTAVFVINTDSIIMSSSELRADCSKITQISTQMSRFEWLILPQNISINSSWHDSGFCITARIFSRPY